MSCRFIFQKSFQKDDIVRYLEGYRGQNKNLDRKSKSLCTIDSVLYFCHESKKYEVLAEDELDKIEEVVSEMHSKSHQGSNKL